MKQINNSKGMLSIPRIAILGIIFVFILFLNSAVFGFTSLVSSSFTCSVSIDIEEPHIEHDPIEEVAMLGNNIDFTATVIDENFTITTGDVYYKIDDGEWSSPPISMTIEAEDNTYTLFGTLPGDDVSSEGIIYYYLAVHHNRGGPYYWKKDSVDVDRDNPQEIVVTNTSSTTIGPLGGTIVLPNANEFDGEVKLVVPAGALSKDVEISITQRDPNDSTIASYNGQRAASVYEFFLSPEMDFLKPVTITLIYPDANNDGDVDVLPIGNNDETQLKGFYWDGYTWKLVGGTVDTTKKTVTFETDHFSLYALFINVANIETYKPKERIITPNGDGYNDKAVFEGLNGTETEIKIFDINGRRVRAISSIPFEWDGKDSGGRTVESGIYIYQFKATIDESEKLITGSIAVAK